MSRLIYDGSATISEAMNTNSQLLTPGETAPDFELTDINGNSVRLSDFHGKKPVVLAFLRGFM
jgi:peroxiredoxin